MDGQRLRAGVPGELAPGRLARVGARGSEVERAGAVVPIRELDRIRSGGERNGVVERRRDAARSRTRVIGAGACVQVPAVPVDDRRCDGGGRRVEHVGPDVVDCAALAGKVESVVRVLAAGADVRIADPGQRRSDRVLRL